MAYTLKIKNMATDGTNIFMEVAVSDGATTMPDIRPTFPADATVASINTYMQSIADNAPTLGRIYQELTGKTYTGA
jgi:hypothetical protein